LPTFWLALHFDGITESNPVLGLKPDSWLTQTVRKIYDELLSADVAFTVEVYEGNLLVGGLFGIALRKLVTLDTMYGLPDPIKLRSASKAALCEAVIQMHAAGIEVVDLEVRHEKGHPASRLGERMISMPDFRIILQNWPVAVQSVSGIIFLAVGGASQVSR
jgi:Leu/Phe-tRNA-protein transferase